MQSDGPHVTILTDAFWRTEFGADPNIIGRIVHLDGKPVTIQRTREIGISLALGAQRRDIMRMVLRRGIRATLAGVGIGVLVGLALTRLLRSLLYGVTPGDWLTFLSVAVLLLVVALAACSIPARRATRVDPIVALRYE